jgi:hypothetical protein
MSLVAEKFSVEGIILGLVVEVARNEKDDFSAALCSPFVTKMISRRPGLDDVSEYRFWLLSFRFLPYFLLLLPISCKNHQIRNKMPGNNHFQKSSTR